MKNHERAMTDMALKLVLRELKEDPYQKFNLAFSLMSIIPFLVFFYLLVVRLFTINILMGNIGFILFIAIFISLCGFSIGYTIISNILKKVIVYAAQAKHSDQLKSTFVATVSHELKNPLSIMKMQILNILDGFAGQISEEQKKILKLCHDVIERMNRLVTDLLDLHKIEAGMVEIERKLCNLTEILEKQIREFEIMLSVKRIKLKKEVHEGTLPVWADEQKVAQIVNNLLSNAIKYTPEEGDITIKIHPFEEFVRLEFLNTGEHIPEDKLEKIFDKFERLNVSKEGTGLGLAITKDIVEMHKGKIWAESQPGAGNKFVILLPRDLRQAKR